MNATSASSVTTDKIPKVTAVDPVNKGIVLNNKIINIKFNEPIVKGNKLIVLKSSGKIKHTKNTLSGKTLSITPTSPLTKGAKYQLIINSGSIKDLNGNIVSSFSTTFTVSKLSLSQVKEGLSRTQKFYNTNYRLPNYVSYGTNKVPISQFQQILASAGLKIKTSPMSIVDKFLIDLFTLQVTI